MSDNDLTDYSYDSAILKRTIQDMLEDEVYPWQACSCGENLKDHLMITVGDDSSEVHCLTCDRVYWLPTGV